MPIDTRGTASSNQIATKRCPELLDGLTRTYTYYLFLTENLFPNRPCPSFFHRQSRTLPFTWFPSVSTLSAAMALRNSTCQLSKTASQAVATPALSSLSATARWKLTPFQRQLRSLATAVHPVTQDATSSKGPTAMVFMNMGGPSTTDEVGDFLSRLFVRPAHPSLLLGSSLEED